MRIQIRHALPALVLALASAAVPAQQTVYQHDFSSTAGWPDSDSSGDLSAVDTVVGGEYLISPLRSLSYALAPAPVRAPGADMAVESDVRLDASNPDSRAGVACRVGDGRNFYAFNLIASGHFEIVRVREGEAEFLARGALGFDPARGSRVRGECVGSSLRLLVDGIELARASDTGLPASGGVGLLSLAPVVASTNAAFDNFALHALGGGQADSGLATRGVDATPPASFGAGGGMGGGGGVLPALEDMAVHADDGSGQPGERRTLFPAGRQQVFVVLDFAAPARASLRAEWFAVRGLDEQHLLSGTLDASGQSQRVYLAAQGDFSPGLYRVEVHADGLLLDQREFSVY